MIDKIFFPPEWYPQSAVQLTWPHAETDWGYMLERVTTCFVEIAGQILKRQKLLIVCRSAETVRFELRSFEQYFYNLSLVELPTNDTWARDHSAISVFDGTTPIVYDFTFNGWGLKFASDYDNQITRGLFAQNKAFVPDVKYVNKKAFVLEGGAIESDGKGTLLTTSECLLSPNRNSYMDKGEIEAYLKDVFGLNRVLWVDHGFLAGDDTDSHIDTLARFCDEHTIAYVKCEDKGNIHYEALYKMEQQLKTFVDHEGNPYRLIPLPMAKTVVEDGEQLPATYANFLIINGAVLLPFYNDAERDTIAKEQLQAAFPDREIIGIDCSALICQHGSLHCVTMQYPQGFIK